MTQKKTEVPEKPIAKRGTVANPKRLTGEPDPKTGKLSRANRTNKIRQRLHEELRDKFKGAEYIRQLEICAGDLSELQKNTAIARKKKLTVKDKESLLIVRVQLETYQFELQVIKTRIDLNIKRLKFVLPELRSVTIEDPNGTNPFASLGAALSQLTKSLAET